MKRLRWRDSEKQYNMRNVDESRTRLKWRQALGLKKGCMGGVQDGSHVACFSSWDLSCQRRG